jgi:neutral ceramidase
MVSVDLFAVPEGLTQKVLQIVNSEGIALPPDRFILAATHTHHSPGSYMTARVHSDVASFKSGYDPALFAWLAKRIAAAVTEAARGSQPSRLTLFEGTACDLQINRSLQPFAENAQAVDILAARNRACGTVANPPLARESAVNPTLRVVGIERLGQERRVVALMIFYAIHPTVLRSRMPLYSGDMVDAGMLHLEQEYEHRGASVVAGFFNGAEGDVIPRKIERDLDEVADLGRRFGEEILQLVDGSPTQIVSSPEVHSNRILLSRAHTGFASRPMPGVALIGGGELDRSQYSPEGWWDGVASTKERIQGQGNKATPFNKRVPFPLPVLGDLLVVKWIVNGAMLPASHFPQHLPIVLAVIPGLMTFVAVPAELTTTMGYRVTNSIQGLTSSDPAVATAFRHAQIVGLANEYFSYVATPNEYALQHYEGASTLLGPGEGPTLEEQIIKLKPTPKSSETIQGKTKFIAGGSKTFGPSYFIDLRAGPTQTNTLPDLELEDVMPERLHFREIEVPRFEWVERCETKTCPADWQPERREIRIVQAESGLVVDRESDLRLVAVLRRGSILPPTPDYVTRDWVAFWIPPKKPLPGQLYAFEVRKGDTGLRICSQSFTLESLPSFKGILPVSLSQGDCPATREAK